MVVGFTETVLRDANQSLIATRLPLNKFEPILNNIDRAGYYSVECWGGATFDACLRYLDEDPWERLRVIRKNMPNTKLQMLLRGQSLLGYKHYSDDVVRKFVFNCIENGIDIIRIFDALNDINNILVAVDESLKGGIHPSCAISYTVSPVHGIENYIKIAKQMEDIGAKSICIKDMAGLLTPAVAYKLVTELKENISVPLILHSHCTTGLAYMTYLKAMEAGVDIIDTAVSSFSGGTSQPATEVILNTAIESGYQVNLNYDMVTEINDHFRKVRNEFIDNGTFDIRVMETDTRILNNQIPGGMYSNLISQMKAQNIFDRFDEVLMEIPRVRKDLGYPPLVTPISQMVGAQAIANILSKERYQTVIKEVKLYLMGEYGCLPDTVDIDLMKRITGKTEFPRYKKSKYLPDVYSIEKEKYSAKQYGRSDLLSLILFPELAKSFLEKRDKKSKLILNYKCTELKRKTLVGHSMKSVESDDIKAIIMAILSKKLNKAVKDIRIKAVYEYE